MATYRKVANLSEVDAAYIAGLIDGEGTITLTRKHRNENRQLEYVLSTVGAGKITRKRIDKTHHTPSFTFAIYNRQALALLNQIHPHLRTYKADRSTAILSDYIRLTPRNGRYSKEQMRLRKDFEESVLNIKAH